MKCILGTKVGMTQVFSEDGAVVPCTLLQVEPCFVAAMKTQEKDSYNAIVLATGKKKRCRPSVKGQMKHL
jgi:large subunit ribosomal protein L3